MPTFIYEMAIRGKRYRLWLLISITNSTLLGLGNRSSCRSQESLGQLMETRVATPDNFRIGRYHLPPEFDIHRLQATPYCTHLPPPPPAFPPHCCSPLIHTRGQFFFCGSCDRVSSHWPMTALIQRALCPSSAGICLVWENLRDQSVASNQATVEIISTGPSTYWESRCHILEFVLC